MKIFVYKQVKPANLEYRKEIIQELYKLKQYPDLADLKKYFRRELRKTYEKVSYFLNYKGISLSLGNADTKNKFLGVRISEDQMRLEIRQQRVERQKSNVKTKSNFLRQSDTHLMYDVKDGVMVAPNVFGTYNKKIRTNKVYKSKVPTTNDPYVGIELEYASALDYDQVAEKIADIGLHDQLKILRDGSIITDRFYHTPLEFCLLSKFSELGENLKKLSTIISPEHFEANDSCGFHVHLDARHIDVKKMFHNLVCMQTLLFDMVDETRIENRFCQPLTTPIFDEVNAGRQHAHWDAISKFAYYKHKTIEVRMHESTTDLNQVEKWVKLLHKIASYKGPSLKFGSLDDTLKQVKNLKLDEELTKYIEEKRLAI